MTIAAPEAPPAAPAPRRPRKVFLLVGLVLAVVVGIGLFTSIGTPAKSGIPQVGDPVPSFSGPRLNGPGTVQVPADGGGGGTPAVLLFFGDWCTVCHAELPPLAAAVRHQDGAGGALAQVRVIGVDSEDTTQQGVAFVTASGVGFPVARDPSTAITSGDFYFQGDPYAVFVKGDGVISAIVAGPLSVARFTAEEEKLVPGRS
ncbi:MAG: TlpA family protein disulfide reductase [Acidimicrobiales bacterium]